MRSRPRKTTPKVRDGKVQRKNRTDRSPHYWNYRQDRVVVDRLRPGQGYRHVLLKRDVERFLEILPEWEELGKGLDAVILAPGQDTTMGWYDDGVVAICAWERELAGPWQARFLDDHAPIVERLDLRVEPLSKHTRLVHWTERSVKAFQLVHILLHELGHHHDLITTRSQRSSSRGEPYAERYACEHAETIWERYFDAFGW